MGTPRTFTAFAGHRQIAHSDIQTTLAATKRRLDDGECEPILIFEDQTGAQIDFDWRGSVDDVLSRLAEHPAFAESLRVEKTQNGPGRPKLGVVSREVSLLPRHWQWLEAQSGGISGAIRRLVDDSRKAQSVKEGDAKRMRDATGRFMWAMAGNFPGFEEASRALFAADQVQFLNLIREWPEDIRKHLTRLTEAVFTETNQPVTLSLK